MSNFIHIEACDFESFPLGGTLTFAKQLISCFPNSVSLVGFVNDGEPIGVWFVKEIDGTKYDFFGICSVEDVKKTRFPKRLFAYFALNKFINKICTNRLENIFTQTPEFVFVLAKHKWKNFCFCFAGLGNSVGLSKYKFLRIFGKVYEKKLFNDLKSSTTKILAASDNNTILQMAKRYGISADFIKQFPTRYDNQVFKVLNQSKCRNQINLGQATKIFITTGRLSYIKGWSLILDAFRIVNEKIPDSIFIFVGDGEDRSKIDDYVSNYFNNNQVILAGRKSPEQVAFYLNAANVFVLGSLVEGWPTSMVEAIACGKTIVSTDISGAREMIIENQNGFVLGKRDIGQFAELMIKALTLPEPNESSLHISTKYSLKNLKSDFEKEWLNEII